MFSLPLLWNIFLKRKKNDTLQRSWRMYISKLCNGVWQFPSCFTAANEREEYKRRCLRAAPVGPRDPDNPLTVPYNLHRLPKNPTTQWFLRRGSSKNPISKGFQHFNITPKLTVPELTPRPSIALWCSRTVFRRVLNATSFFFSNEAYYKEHMRSDDKMQFASHLGKTEDQN